MSPEEKAAALACMSEADRAAALVSIVVVGAGGGWMDRDVWCVAGIDVA